MKLPRAVISGLVLLVASTAFVALGDEATDPVVIAGTVGIVVAASLLGLTALAARWRGGSGRYVTSAVDQERGATGELLAAFDEQPAALRHEDSAAV